MSSLTEQQSHEDRHCYAKCLDYKMPKSVVLLWIIKTVVHITLVCYCLRSRCGHYIFALWFLLSSFFLLFSSPNLNRHRLDVCHTCTHGVALVRIQDAGLKRTWLAEKYRTQKIDKNTASGCHRRTLSGYIFAAKARIDNRKKNLLSSKSPQYAELRPSSGWDRPVVWGTPANFNGYRVLAALLHGTPVVGVSQTLRRWT